MDRQRATILNNLPPQWHAVHPVDPPPHSEPHPGDIISLLRDCNCHSPDLIQSLLYKLSILTFPRATRPIVENPFGRLSQADIDHFITGCVKLRTEYTNSIRYTAPAACLSANCKLTLLEFWTHVAVPFLLTRDSQSRPVESWIELGKIFVNWWDVLGGDGSSERAVCTDCKTVFHGNIVLQGDRMKAVVRTCLGSA